MGSTTFKATFLGDASGLKKEIGGVSSALSGIGKVAGGLVLGAAIFKAPGVLMDMAQAAAEDEAATLRLNQALQNLGGDIAGNTAKVTERIAVGQKLAFSDDDVRDSFQALAAATGDADEALARQTAAMDLARGAGIPLSTATKLLGKINEENVDVFRRMGIVLGENATETDALAAVQAKFGGQAETFAKSTAGQFEQLKIRLSEAAETIGAALIPIMAKVGSILATEVIPRIEAFAAAVGPKLQEGFALFKSDVLPVLQDIGAAIEEHVLPPLQRLADWWTGNGEAMKASAVALGAVLTVMFTAWAVSAGAAAVATIAAAAPIIAIVAAVALLSAGVYLLISNWDTLTAKYPALGTATDAAKSAMQAFADWITGSFVPAIQLIATTTGEVGADVVKFTREAWDQVAPIVKPVIDQVEDYIRFIADVVQEVFSLVINLVQGDWAGAWDDAKDILGAFKTFGEETLNNLLAFIRGLGSLFWEAAKNIGQMVWDGIKAGLGNLYDMFRGVMQDAIDGLQSMAGSLVQKAKDIAGQIASALNPANWVGSPVGVQNWYPYYLDQGLENMARVAVASDAPQRAADAINAGLHPVIGGQLATAGSIAVASRGLPWDHPLQQLNEELTSTRESVDRHADEIGENTDAQTKTTGAIKGNIDLAASSIEELTATLTHLQGIIARYPDAADTYGKTIIALYEAISTKLREAGHAGTPPPLDFATMDPTVGQVDPRTGRTVYGQPGVSIDPQAVWNPKTGKWEHAATGAGPQDFLTFYPMGTTGPGSHPGYSGPNGYGQLTTAGGTVGSGNAPTSGVKIDNITINLGAGAGRQQGEDAANGFLGVMRQRGVMT